MSNVSLPGVPDDQVVGLILPGQIEGLDFDVAIPVVEMNWHDERTGCALAHFYLAGDIEGRPSDFDDCHFYQSGRCSMNGRQDGRCRSACLFREPEDSKGWEGVKRWMLLECPDGTTCLTLRSSAVEIADDLGAKIIGWQADQIRAEVVRERG